MKSITAIKLLSDKLDSAFELLESWDSMDYSAKAVLMDDLIKTLAKFWIATGSNVENKNACNLYTLTREVNYTNAMAFLTDQFIDRTVRESYYLDKSLHLYYMEVEKLKNDRLMSTINDTSTFKRTSMNQPIMNLNPEHLTYIVSGILVKNGFSDLVAEEFAATYINQYGDEAITFVTDIYPEDLDIY